MTSPSSSIAARALLRRQINAPVLGRSMATIYRPLQAMSESPLVSKNNARFFSVNPKDLIPGVPLHQSSYGSLGDPTAPIASELAGHPASWQAHDDADVQRVTAQALIYELTRTTSDTIEQVVPWFLNTMPESYFRQIPPYLRRDHVKALAAVVDADMDLYLNLKTKTSDGRTVYTFVRPSTEPGTLLGMVQELPRCDLNSPSLTRLHVFSALDESFALNMFIMGDVKQPSERHRDRDRDHHRNRAAPYTPNREMILRFASEVRAGNHTEDYPDLDPDDPCFQPEALESYLDKCRDNYLRAMSNHPERFLKQRLLFGAVRGTEGCEVQIDKAVHELIQCGKHKDQPQYWLDVAMANSLPQVALEHTCRLLYLRGFDVARARLDVIPDDDGNGNGNVAMLRLLIHPVEDDREGDQHAANFERLRHDLKRSKWLDDTTMKLVFEDEPWLGVKRGEIITAMCNLMHPILSRSGDRDNSSFYSKHNILQTVTDRRSIGYAASIADLFLQRFDPENPLNDDELFRNKLDEIRNTIASDVQETYVREILHKMTDVVEKTYKTNIYMKNRYALSLRLDPSIMGVGSTKDSTLPYGVLFIHGRRFNGYHTRFRDIARGGLRLVAPASSEQLALESARQYGECYGLAFAQQLKNKDIPEGGSKAVCLIDTNDILNGTRDYVLRKSVKAMVDSILDLVVDTDETRENIVDYFGKREVLYLGPDENVTHDDINWIIQRAEQRGYDTPSAFMSSKPKAGINHKEYGVTSEGVNVFMEVALQHVLGLDPRKESFTVKITGGPNGDVAGNEIKIMIREYGDNVKIVGIADHSGCAEDPDGLNHEELLRLFEAELSIGEFDATRLGPSGVLHTCDTEEGTKARNTMHNRLDADAFVPCGGRPNTIDINNYKQFLHEDGTPTSKLIVEGANLFVTAEARQKLYDEAGVMIVKDSSANKGGVITSSYEICAAMLASKEEFFENKEAIVAEVLAKLRGFAKMEAELLFREAELYGESLPEVSKNISNAINAIKDTFSAALDSLPPEDQEQLVPLFRGHLPETLANLGFDKVHEKVPSQYIKNAIASTLASKMVYKEGTRFITELPTARLAEIALRYIQQEKEVAKLIDTLEKTEMSSDEKKKILELLDAGGTRTALRLKDM
mmetsp:Transcript_6089/g.15116  ORF Transcript_6089/g.15116 Transcript_6089/m.15116 type:complete len:1143 (-) Transcript_6089:205-3633(-)